jgi:hypothetical protein
MKKLLSKLIWVMKTSKKKACKWKVLDRVLRSKITLKHLTRSSQVSKTSQLLKLKKKRKKKMILNYQLMT